MGVVAVQAFNEGNDRPFEVALYYARIYMAGVLLSSLGFIVSLIALLKSSR